MPLVIATVVGSNVQVTQTLLGVALVILDARGMFQQYYPSQEEMSWSFREGRRGIETFQGLWLLC